MIRNLKALGLALVAVFAMSAMTASAASATDFFTTEEPTAWLTGVGHDNKFTVGNTNFECTTSKFTATVENGDSEATVLPKYTGTKPDPKKTEHENETAETATHCNSSVGTVTIDVNHCHYVLTGDTTGDHNSEVDKDATVWIQCEPNQTIKITSSAGPVISVPSQTPTEGGVTYTNVPNHEESGKSGVLVTATVTGVTSTCSPAFTCGLAGIPTHGNGSRYTGTVNITGYKDLGSADESATNKLTTPTEGSKINIEVSS